MSAFRGIIAILAIAICAIAAPAQSFDAKGVKVLYSVEGKGEPVVMIHGLYSSGWINWTLTGVTKELARDHKVILLDLPGHGLSERPAKKEAYGEQIADDIVLLLDHLKIKKAHIVGYSLGGMVTMKVLAKHPERVISGTVAGMGWFQEGSLPQKVFEKFKGGGLGPPQEFFDTIGGLALTEADVKKIKVPVKIIVGDKDFVRGLYVDPLAKVRKDWPIVEIKDGDHISTLLRPQFKEEIGAWVRKNSK